MGNTEPSANFESSLIFIQHFCGVFMFAFNGSIILLIMFDGDDRNRSYRKYLCCLQIVSLTSDTLSDIYSPIFFMHKGVGYSDSFVSRVISLGKFMVLEVFLLVEVIFAYFACVHYRRYHVLGPARRFNYCGWRRNLLFISLQVYGMTVLSALIYFMRRSIIASENHLPADLEWVNKRTTYLFMLPDENLHYVNFLATFSTGIVAIAIIGMLVQVIFQVKKGSSITSATTLRYQRSMVRSLVLQGAVPSLVYVIPSYINGILQRVPSFFDTGETFNNFANVISPIMWICITKHTFAGSLTILYCSPSYRKKIVNMRSVICSCSANQHSEKVRDITA